MSNGVPAALQNAMNGPQDSKPFTYLPGGLDFSEIRSPRMAKRLAKHQVILGPPTGNMDQKSSLPFGGSMPNRGSSVPRLPGPGDASLPPKPSVKKQKSIKDMLSMPDSEPTYFSPEPYIALKSGTPIIGKEPYNPYAQNNNNNDYKNSFNNPSYSNNNNCYPVTLPQSNETPSWSQSARAPELSKISNNFVNNTPIHREYLEEYKPTPQKVDTPPPPPAPKPVVQLPPQAPKGPPGRAPPPPPPPPPPGYLTEDLPELLSGKNKTKSSKIGQVQAQLEHEREEKREEERRQREIKEMERRERERREREEQLRIEREREEQLRLEREREEFLRMEIERQEQERIEKERQELLRMEREREEQMRREREENERREREELERRQNEALFEQQLRETEELNRRERQLKLEIERIKKEQEREEMELRNKYKEIEESKAKQWQMDETDYDNKYTNGEERHRHECEHEDDFTWTPTINDMEKMEYYEEDIKSGEEIPVSNFKLDIQTLKIPTAPLPPPPPPHQHLQQAPRVMTMPPAAVRPPLAPAMPKGRRNFQSPSPTSSPVPPSDSFRKAVPPLAPLSMPLSKPREVPVRLTPSPPSAPIPPPHSQQHHHQQQQKYSAPKEEEFYYDNYNESPQQHYQQQLPAKQYQQQKQFEQSHPQQRHYEPSAKPQQQQQQQDFFSSLMMPPNDEFFGSSMLPTFPQFFNAQGPFGDGVDFAPALTPMFGAPQIPMMPKPVQPVNTPSYQQANPSSSGGRVIPIQIESKVKAVPKSNSYDAVDRITQRKPTEIKREIRIKVERTPPPTPPQTPTPTPPPTRANPMQFSNPVSGASRNSQMDNLVTEIQQRPMSFKTPSVRQQSLQDPASSQPGYPEPIRQNYPDPVKQPGHPDLPRKQQSFRQQSFQDPEEMDEPLMDIELRIQMARRASEPPDARKAVMGEFASFAGGKPSRIAGRKKPSQSPSMWLLGRTYMRRDSEGDQEDEIVEGTGVSKEYTGELGRYLPPRAGRPLPQEPSSSVYGGTSDF